MGRVHLVRSKVLFRAEAAYENSIIAHIRMFEIYSNLSGNQFRNHSYKAFKALFHLFEVLLFAGAAGKILETPHYYMYKHNLCMVK